MAALEKGHRPTRGPIQKPSRNQSETRCCCNEPRPSSSLRRSEDSWLGARRNSGRAESRDSGGLLLETLGKIPGRVTDNLQERSECRGQRIGVKDWCKGLVAWLCYGCAQTQYRYMSGKFLLVGVNAVYVGLLVAPKKDGWSLELEAVPLLTAAAKPNSIFNHTVVGHSSQACPGKATGHHSSKWRLKLRLALPAV